MFLFTFYTYSFCIAWQRWQHSAIQSMLCKYLSRFIISVIFLANKPWCLDIADHNNLLWICLHSSLVWWACMPVVYRAVLCKSKMQMILLFQSLLVEVGGQPYAHRSSSCPSKSDCCPGSTQNDINVLVMLTDSTWLLQDITELYGVNSQEESRLKQIVQIEL